MSVLLDYRLYSVCVLNMRFLLSQLIVFIFMYGDMYSISTELNKAHPTKPNKANANSASGTRGTDQPSRGAKKKKTVIIEEEEAEVCGSVTADNSNDTADQRPKHAPT